MHFSSYGCGISSERSLQPEEIEQFGIFHDFSDVTTDLQKKLIWKKALDSWKWTSDLHFLDLQSVSRAIWGEQRPHQPSS